MSEDGILTYEPTKQLEEINEILHNWAVYSNLFLLIPIYISYIYKSNIGILLIFMMFISIMYHIDPSNLFWDWTDQITSVLLFLYVIYYLFKIIGKNKNKILMRNNKGLTFLIISLCIIALVIFAFAWILFQLGYYDKNTGFSGKLFNPNPENKNESKSKTQNFIKFSQFENVKDFDYTFYHILWHILVSIVISLIVIYINLNPYLYKYSEL